jgi:hypothetical protein
MRKPKETKGVRAQSCARDRREVMSKYISPRYRRELKRDCKYKVRASAGLGSHEIPKGKTTKINKDESVNRRAPSSLVKKASSLLVM